MNALISRWKDLEQVHWAVCLDWARKGDKLQAEASRARATTLSMCVQDLELEVRRQARPVFVRRRGPTRWIKPCVPFVDRLRQWLS